MSTAGRLLLMLFAVAMVIVAAAPYRHKTCPQVRCGLPERDYQFGSYSQPDRSLSSPAVLLPVAPANDGQATTTLDAPLVVPSDHSRQRIKAFQFVEKSTLQIDHCSLSQISILLHQSGNWTASMRANQNPLPDEAPLAPQDVTTAEPARLLTDPLLRNKFIVKVRCYAGSIVGDADGLVGKPLVIPLNIQPFWVQKAQPDDVYASGFDPRIQDYFDLIERVEIEFTYQYD